MDSFEKYPGMLLVPAIVVLGVLTLIPFGNAVYLSLHAIDLSKPYLGRPFVGFENYLEVFNDERARNAFANTFILVGSAVGIQVILGLAVALLLQKIGKYKDTMLMLVIIPMLISRVVTALLWKILFHPMVGPINWFLTQKLGIPAVEWLANPILAKFSIIIADTWQWVPFMILIFSAGMETLSKHVYEAAAIDGASKWRTFLSITFPLLLPFILVGILFRVMEAMRTFDLIYVMTQGGPGISTETVDIYAYLVGLSKGARISYSATLAIILLVLTIGTFMIFIRLLKGEREYV